MNRLGAVADQERFPVMLVAVDELVLEQLVQAATTDAAADDVTPPLTVGTDWTATRVKWLQDFHRTAVTDWPDQPARPPGVWSQPSRSLAPYV